MKKLKEDPTDDPIAAVYDLFPYEIPSIFQSGSDSLHRTDGSVGLCKGSLPDSEDLLLDLDRFAFSELRLGRVGIQFTSLDKRAETITVEDAKEKLPDRTHRPVDDPWWSESFGVMPDGESLRLGVHRSRRTHSRDAVEQSNYDPALGIVASTLLPREHKAVLTNYLRTDLEAVLATPTAGLDDSDLNARIASILQSPHSWMAQHELLHLLYREQAQQAKADFQKLVASRRASQKILYLGVRLSVRSQRPTELIRRYADQFVDVFLGTEAFTLSLSGHVHLRCEMGAHATVRLRPYKDRVEFSVDFDDGHHMLDHLSSKGLGSSFDAVSFRHAVESAVAPYLLGLWKVQARTYAALERGSGLTRHMKQVLNGHKAEPTRLAPLLDRLAVERIVPMGDRLSTRGKLVWGLGPFTDKDTDRLVQSGLARVHRATGDARHRVLQLNDPYLFALTRVSERRAPSFIRKRLAATSGDGDPLHALDTSTGFREELRRYITEENMSLVSLERLLVKGARRWKRLKAVRRKLQARVDEASPVQTDDSADEVAAPPDYKYRRAKKALEQVLRRRMRIVLTQMVLEGEILWSEIEDKVRLRATPEPHARPRRLLSG